MSADKLGVRIRTFREEKAMSRNELATRTGLNADYIRALEEEEAYPVLGCLTRIARALGVRLGSFLDDQVSRDPLIIRLEERVPELSMPGGRNKPATLKYCSLGRGKSDRHMEPFHIEILPESAKEKTPSSHEGEEFIVVLSGEVELIYGEEVHLLSTGDSMYYNSVVPHYISCRGGKKAEVYAVFYIPE